MSQNTQKIIDESNLKGEEVTSPASPNHRLLPPPPPRSVPILMSNMELIQTLAMMREALKTVST